MEEFILVMKALSDFNRVRILKLLQTRELCACEVQRVLGLSQSTVSKHLKTLEKAGLVEKERLGNWMLLSLTDGRQSEYAETMLVELCQWLNDDEILENMHRELAKARLLRDCR